MSHATICMVSVDPELAESKFRRRSPQTLRDGEMVSSASAMSWSNSRPTAEKKCNKMPSSKTAQATNIQWPQILVESLPHVPCRQRLAEESVSRELRLLLSRGVRGRHGPANPPPSRADPNHGEGKQSSTLCNSNWIMPTQNLMVNIREFCLLVVGIVTSTLQ